MVGTPTDRIRRWVGIAMILAVCIALLWTFSPGLPVLWGPHANPEVRQAGQILFEHEWQAEDPLAHGAGLGPVFNASSCAACHSQGGVGGGGPNNHNVMTFEVHPTARDPQVRLGALHQFALDPACKDTPDALHVLFPVVKGGRRVINNCNVNVADFDPILLQSVNTPALFGDGWIDRIPAKAITHSLLQKNIKASARELTGDFNSDIPPGRERILADGRIGKFGWKAQFATLEEFVGAACANELGLTNPLKERALPIARTTVADAPAALDREQFRAMAAFVDTLPRPVEVLPAAGNERAQAVRGKKLFVSAGCAGCHTPDVGGVQGVYSDFLLHHIDDPEQRDEAYGPAAVVDVPLPSDQPAPDEWKTPPLWGVADSAPYFHDGGSPTLMDAILRHHGDASKVTRGFRDMHAEDQEAIVAFLKTLKAPPDAAPAKPEKSADQMAKG